MKKQFAVVFICALLSPSIGNDHPKTRQKPHHTENKQLHSHHRNLGHQSNSVHHAADRHQVHKPHNRHQSHHVNVAPHHHFYQNRDGNEQCGWVCSSPDSSGFELYVNQSANLLGIVNVTAEVAIVFDLSTSSFAVFNGAKGLTVAVDSKSQIVIEITSSAQDSTVIWLASNQSFEVFFHNLLSVQAIIETGERIGQTSNVSNPNSSVVREVIVIVSQLGVDVSGISDSNVLKLLVNISQTFVEIYNSPLRRLLTRVTHVHIEFGVQRLSQVLRGLLNLLTSIQGGPQIVLNGTVNLNIKLILNTSSGIEILINFLNETGAHLDLSKIFGNVLNNPEELLKIIVQLGGNSTRGLEGLFNVLYNIIGVINNHVPVQNLINLLIKIVSQGGLHLDPSELRGVINQLLKIVNSQNSIFHNASSLQGFVQFLQNLLNNNLDLGGVNISNIIKLLQQGHFQNPMDLIIQVIVQLGNAVNPSKIIPRLFGTLIALLNNTQGASIVSRLIPGLNISQIIGTNGLQSILNGTNLSQLLNSTSNFGSALSHIPVIGTVYDVISHSLESASHGSLNLQNLLNSSSIISNIEGLLEGEASGVVNTIGQIGGTIQNITTGIISGIGGVLGWGNGGSNGGLSGGGNGGLFGGLFGGGNGGSSGDDNRGSSGGNEGSSGGNGGSSGGDNRGSSGGNEGSSGGNGSSGGSGRWSGTGSWSSGNNGSSGGGSQSSGGGNESSGSSNGSSGGSGGWSGTGSWSSGNNGSSGGGNESSGSSNGSSGGSGGWSGTGSWSSGNNGSSGGGSESSGSSNGSSDGSEGWPGMGSWSSGNNGSSGGGSQSSASSNGSSGGSGGWPGTGSWSSGNNGTSGGGSESSGSSNGSSGGSGGWSGTGSWSSGGGNGGSSANNGSSGGGSSSSGNTSGGNSGNSSSGNSSMGVSWGSPGGNSSISGGGSVSSGGNNGSSSGHKGKPDHNNSHKHEGSGGHQGSSNHAAGSHHGHGDNNESNDNSHGSNGGGISWGNSNNGQIGGSFDNNGNGQGSVGGSWSTNLNNDRKLHPKSKNQNAAHNSHNIKKENKAHPHARHNKDN